MPLVHQNPMATSPDVLIIGGGVIGLTTAFYLRRDMNRRVTLLERGPLARESSWAGAGIIPPAARTTAQTPMTRLLRLSVELFPTLSADLREITGIDNEFRVCGGIELVSGISDATVELWRAEGIEFRRLNADELRPIEPCLAREIEDGYFLPEMAQVRNPRHLAALISACRRLGVELVEHSPVTDWVRRDDRVESVRAGQEVWSAERFLVTAGAWTDELIAPLGNSLAIRPIRGQIVLMRPERPLLRRIISHGLDYLVPRLDGRILVGSTEEDVGFQKGNTTEAVERLRRFAYHLVPDLAKADIEMTWSGLRPEARRGIPHLGRLPGFKNLFVAAGHFRSGLMLSAATGWLMAQQLCDLPTDISCEPFQPG